MFNLKIYFENLGKLVKIKSRSCIEKLFNFISFGGKKIGAKKILQITQPSRRETFLATLRHCNNVPRGVKNKDNIFTERVSEANE